MVSKSGTFSSFSMTLAVSPTRQRAIFWVFVLIDVILWVLAFSWKPPRLDSAPIVAVNIWPGTESLIAAREMGKVTTREINFVEMSWSSSAMRAFGNRAIDASVLALSEVLLMRELGYPIRVIMAVDESVGADAIVAGPGINGVPELRGKRVGVEIRSVGHYLLGRALQDAGMSIDDVELVPVVLPEIETAFTELGVDAVVAAEPWLSRINARGGRVIYDSADTPGEIIRVMIARDVVIERSPAPLGKLLDAHFGLADPTDWSEDARVGILRREGVSAPEFDRIRRGVRLYSRTDQTSMLSGESPSLTAALDRVAARMRELDLLTGGTNNRLEIDDRFVTP